MGIKKSSGTVKVSNAAAITLGTVAIDQTTPGTTNGVQLTGSNVVVEANQLAVAAGATTTVKAVSAAELTSGYLHLTGYYRNASAAAGNFYATFKNTGGSAIASISLATTSAWVDKWLGGGVGGVELQIYNATAGSVNYDLWARLGQF